MRRLRVLGLVLPALLALLSPPHVNARSACDRACLADIMTRYLASLVAHNPKQAPLAANARFTEDSEGAADRRRALEDRVEAAAVSHRFPRRARRHRGRPRSDRGERRADAVRRTTQSREQEDHRDRDDGRAQSEGRRAVRAGFSRAAVARHGGDAVDSAAHAAPKMVDIALRYPGGLRVGSFEKSDVPFAPDAYRFENGVRMAGPGCTFRPPSCENMRSQQLPTLAGIQASVAAVDEENGTVLLYMDFGEGSLPGPDSAGKALVTFEAFKVYGGRDARRRSRARRHAGRYAARLEIARCRPVKGLRHYLGQRRYRYNRAGFSEGARRCAIKTSSSSTASCL